MSTAEGLGGGSRPEAVALGEVLTFFGSIADYAAQAAPEDGTRIAALASAMGVLAGLSQQEIDALYFAALLRNLGALGNPGFGKGEQLPARAQTMQRWDVPSGGARLCERIAALPPETADLVRWQAECWDGTGFPDQLRWYGIPQAAGILHVASAYAAAGDPEEAFAQIEAESGRSFAPEHVRTFVTWLHSSGGTIESVAPPFHALDPARTAPANVIEMIAERVDAHNGTPLRAQRIARRVALLGSTLDLSPEERRQLQVAALLFGVGEIRSAQLEAQQFDPLARLGIEARAAHACAAEGFALQCPYVASAAPALRSRAEWYDGTGRPDGLRHHAIPRAAHLLAVAIAHDALDESYGSRGAQERATPLARMETAAGTQFDPRAIAALAEIVNVRT